VWGGAAELAAAESQSNDGLVDVSDYALELESLSAASCDTGASLKFKKVNLGGNKTVTLTAAVSGMFVTVFPTKGDVDAGVFCRRPERPPLSIRNAGELDVASCFYSNCVGIAGVGIRGVVRNPLSSQATYVGGFLAFVAN
jgi:hypothetical protein